MARRNRIRGLTIEIGGDTTKLQDSLKGVNSQISNTQTRLKDVERLLKLDPGNTELLAQRHKLLGQEVSATRQKLDQLKQANEQVSASAKNYDAWKEKYKPIKQEITETQTKLRELKEKSAEADRQLAEGRISQDKYDALQAELKETETRLKNLKQKAKEVDDEFGKPISPEQYDALQREIIETTQDLKELEKQSRESGEKVQSIAASGEKLKELGSNIQAAGEKIEGVGETVTTHVTVPLAAAGAASVAAWKEVDEGLDIVIEKTGATGKAAEALQEIVKNIASDIPTDFATAGEAVGEVNTRFGITGDSLETLSSQFIKFAELNKTDVSSSIDITQKALSAYGLTAEDAAGFLDRMNKVGQDTGVSVDKLAEGIVSNATAFKEMGMDIDQATTFMGQLEKSGANSETVLNGMRKALKQATKDGKPLNVALTELQDTIRNGTGSIDGLTAAYDLFGKSGDQIYGAVKDGTINFADFAAAVDSAAGSVSNTFEATKDPLDDMKTVMNEIKLIGADIVTSAGPMISQALAMVRDIVKDLSEKWNGLSDAQKEMIIKIALVVAAIGPLLIVVGKVVTTIGAVIGTIGSLMSMLPTIAAVLSGVLVPAITGLIAVITGTVLPAIASVLVALAPFLIGGAIIAGIIAGVVLLAKYIARHWDEIKASIGRAVDAIKKKVGGIWDHIRGIFSRVRQGFSGFVSNAFGWGSDLISNFIQGIRAKLQNLWDTVKSVAQGVRDYIGFSEPEKGPLSDFHTYAPDMMKLFLQGLQDYAPLVQSQLAKALTVPDLETVPAGAAGTGGSGGNRYEVAPAGLARSEPRTQTVILQVDRTQLGRVVYQVNNEEAQRVGVDLRDGR